MNTQKYLPLNVSQETFLTFFDIIKRRFSQSSRLESNQPLLKSPFMVNICTAGLFFLNVKFAKKSDRQSREQLLLGGSITVQLVSSLTRPNNMQLFVCSEAVESKLVKLETNRTVILPQMVSVLSLQREIVNHHSVTRFGNISTL